MPRPKTVSDEAVLTGALAVLAARGAEFTLTDLAEHVGLSRATLIQRFGDRDAILLRMAQHEVALTRSWLDSLPVEAGQGALWRFLTTIVESMEPAQGFSARVAIAALEIRDPRLRVLAGQRYELVQRAIALRLPDGPDRKAQAGHIHAIIAGATMQWVATDGSTGLSAFILDRLRWFLADRNLA
jgi:AcrR family transcriptional regulator